MIAENINLKCRTCNKDYDDKTLLNKLNSRKETVSHNVKIQIDYKKLYERAKF